VLKSNGRNAMPSKSRQDEEKRLWNQLLGFIEEGSVVPVIGPELLQVRTGDGQTKNFYTLVAEELASELELPQPRTSGWRAMNEVACSFLEQDETRRPKDLCPDVKAIVQRLQRSTPIPEPLARLAALPFRLFVTTTFDTLLVRAIEEQVPSMQGRVREIEYAPARVKDLETFRDDEGPPVVFHLFGKISTSPEYAITDEDVLEFMLALQSEERSPRNLFKYLRGKNLLIVGCGFPDWLARFFIRLGKPSRLSGAYDKTDMLADSAAENPDFVAFIERFSHDTKRFSMGPVEFVAGLHAAVSARPVALTRSSFETKPRDPDRDIKEGAVFLSYASEDRNIVESIQKALDQSGVDCWFDRVQLQGGDDWHRKIVNNVRACSLFIAIVSKHTLTPEDRFFRVEWREALERKKWKPDRPFVVPVVIDDTKPEAPTMLDDFRALHWLTLENGEVTPDFIGVVKTMYRDNQQPSLATH
jgi:hypothetical protein